MEPLAGQHVCTEMWSYSFTGEPASGQTHVVANLSATVGIMAVTYFQFSDAGSDRAFGGVAMGEDAVPWGGTDLERPGLCDTFCE